MRARRRRAPPRRGRRLARRHRGGGERGGSDDARRPPPRNATSRGSHTETRATGRWPACCRPCRRRRRRRRRRRCRRRSVAAAVAAASVAMATGLEPAFGDTSSCATRARRPSRPPPAPSTSAASRSARVCGCSSSSAVNFSREQFTITNDGAGQQLRSEGMNATKVNGTQYKKGERCRWKRTTTSVLDAAGGAALKMKIVDRSSPVPAVSSRCIRKPVFATERTAVCCRTRWRPAI